MHRTRLVNILKTTWPFWAGLFLLVVFSYSLTTLLIGPYFGPDFIHLNNIYPAEISPDGEYMIVSRYERSERYYRLNPLYFYLLHIPSGESWDLNDRAAWEYAADRDQVTYIGDGQRITFTPTVPGTHYDIQDIESSRGHHYGFNILDPETGEIIRTVTYKSIYHFGLPLGLRLTASQALIVMFFGFLLSLMVVLNRFNQPGGRVIAAWILIATLICIVFISLGRFAVKID